MAKYKDPRLKQGVFDKQNMLIHIGGVLSKPENIYDLQVVKMPDFTISYKERESLGNGWYGSTMETITKTIDNCYIVIKDNKPFGYFIYYPSDHKQQILAMYTAYKAIINYSKTINS